MNNPTENDYAKDSREIREQMKISDFLRDDQLERRSELKENGFKI